MVINSTKLSNPNNNNLFSLNKLFLKNKDSIFYEWNGIHLINNADILSFKILSNWCAKDKNFVFYFRWSLGIQSIKLDNSDSFRKIWQKGELYIDEYYLYVATEWQWLSKIEWINDIKSLSLVDIICTSVIRYICMDDFNLYEFYEDRDFNAKDKLYHFFVFHKYKKNSPEALLMLRGLSIKDQ